MDENMRERKRREKKRILGRQLSMRLEQLIQTCSTLSLRHFYVNLLATARFYKSSCKLWMLQMAKGRTEWQKVQRVSNLMCGSALVSPCQQARKEKKWQIINSRALRFLWSRDRRRSAVELTVILLISCFLGERNVFLRDEYSPGVTHVWNHPYVL